MRNAMKTTVRRASSRKPKGGGIVTLKFHAETGERLPDDAEGDVVIVETFDLGEEPEIQVAASEVKRLRSDKKLFFGLQGQGPDCLDCPKATTRLWPVPSRKPRDPQG